MNQLDLNFEAPQRPPDREVRFIDWHPPQWQASVTEDGVVRCCSTCRNNDHMTEVRDEKTGNLRGYTCLHRKHDPDDTAFLKPCGGWVGKENP